MNTAGGIFLRNVPGIREPVRRPECLDQAFFNPSLDMIRDPPERSIFGVAADIQQLRHRAPGSLEQAVDGIGLYPVKREFSKNLLFVFGENWSHMGHFCFLTKRKSAEAVNFRYEPNCASASLIESSGSNSSE